MKVWDNVIKGKNYYAEVLARFMYLKSKNT